MRLILMLILVCWSAFGYRSRRDYNDPHEEYEIVCKTSNTGLYSFLAVPLLLSDIMLDFMAMIDVNVNVMVDIDANATNTGSGNNNNNNNNNNNGGDSVDGGDSSTDSTSSGNNNNNNNNGKRKKRNVEDYIVKMFLNLLVHKANN